MAVVRFDGATLIRTDGLFASAATQLTFAARLAFPDLTSNQWLFSPPIAAGPEGGIFKLHSSWLPFWGVSLSALGIAAGDAFSLMLAIDTAGGLSGYTGKLWINGAEVQTQSGVGSGPVDLSALDLFGSYWNAAVCATVDVTDWVWLADAALDPATHWASFFDEENRPKSLPSGGTIGGVAPGLYIKGSAARWNSELDENGNAYNVTSPSGVSTGGVVLDVSDGHAEAEGDTLTAVTALIEGTISAGATVTGQMLAGSASLVDGSAGAGATVEGQVLIAAGGLVAGTASGIRSPTVPGQVLTAAASLIAGAGGAASLSKRERVLKALFAALEAAKPEGAVVLRNAVFPERVPAAGLMILRDGDPGEPEFLFSPPRWYYEHRAEIDVLVAGPTPAARDAAFDRLLQTIGQALADDRTLGGLVDFALGEAPKPLDLAVEGAEGLKAATIVVVLPYDTGDPLG